MVALNQTVDTSTPASSGLPTGEYTGVVISEEVKTSQKGAQYLRYTLQVTEGAQQGKQKSPKPVSYTHLTLPTIYSV